MSYIVMYPRSYLEYDSAIEARTAAEELFNTGHRTPVAIYRLELIGVVEPPKPEPERKRA